LDSLLAVLTIVVLLLPLVPLLVIGTRRRWQIRNYGPYLLSYVFFISLGLLAGLGMRGWILVFGALASAAGAGVAFLVYARVAEIGEELRRRR